MNGPLILVGQKRVRDLEVGDVIDVVGLSSWSPTPTRPEWVEITELVPADSPDGVMFIRHGPSMFGTETTGLGIAKFGHDLVTAQIEVVP